MSTNTYQSFSIEISDLELIKEFLVSKSLETAYESKKHLLEFWDKDANRVAFIRLPLVCEVQNDFELLELDNSVVVYLTIESGNAALCVMEGDELIYHTTFSAYMVRKKQGFSQVKYLNKKGKSRAGSRVRLAATEEFFNEINSKLCEVFDEIEVDKIALDCNKTLMPYFYSADELPPWTKTDERIYKIPLHIDQSNHVNLVNAIRVLSKPRLFFQDAIKREDLVDLLDNVL